MNKNPTHALSAKAKALVDRIAKDAAAMPKSDEGKADEQQVQEVRLAYPVDLIQAIDNFLNEQPIRLAEVVAPLLNGLRTTPVQVELTATIQQPATKE